MLLTVALMFICSSHRFIIECIFEKKKKNGILKIFNLSLVPLLIKNKEKTEEGSIELLISQIKNSYKFEIVFNIVYYKYC